MMGCTGTSSAGRSVGRSSPDRLFFFGAYQGTLVRQAPASNIAYVPSTAMLAGDFTAFASPACNGGRQIALRGGFENNRIDPARFSPAALNLVKRLAQHDRSMRADYLPHHRGQ